MHNAQCYIGETALNFQFSLPLSKSVRARELVLDALNGRCVEVEDDNDDIFVLSRALNQCTMHNAQLSDHSDNSQLSILNLNASGTALRFLTAFCAVSERSFLLTGSKRLCERPIKPLVNALLGMGAKIEYIEKEGFAPLLIEGGKLNGGRVSLDASVSSQFVSALMLIADRVEGGVEIEYEGNVASQSYIKLTESVIERYKRGVCCSGEKDWSSATVWYAVMAVLKRGKFLLEGLSLDSCQPDRAIVEVFEKLGVRTIEVDNGVEIEASGEVVEKLVLDCKNMPDAVMYIAVAACLLGVDFEISGVETLRVKESDRIEALITEMRKCGYIIQCTMHNAQCTIFAISENNQTCLDCRAEQKSRQKGVIFAISENNQTCLDCRAEQKSRQKGVMHNAQCIMHNAQCIMHNAQCTIFAISEDNQACLDCRAEQKSRQKEVIHNLQLDGQVPRIKTYNDHRVAMAMAVVGLVMDVEIENPEVVNKSYPGFWEEMKKIK